MVKGDNDNLYFGDGSKRPLTTHDYTMPYGKYEGLTIGEMTDVNYLQWMLRNAVEKREWFVERLVTMRLKELT